MKGLSFFRKYGTLLDSQFKIPGTKIRFGLDSLVGIIPGGDILMTAVSSSIVFVAAKQSVPMPILLRMVFNIGIDLLIGAIPVLGDIFDVFWKSNIKNVELLEQYSVAPGKTKRVSSLKLGFVIFSIIFLFAAIIGITISVMGLLFERLQEG